MRRCCSWRGRARVADHSITSPWFPLESAPIPINSILRADGSWHIFKPPQVTTPEQARVMELEAEVSRLKTVVALMEQAVERMDVGIAMIESALDDGSSAAEPLAIETGTGEAEANRTPVDHVIDMLDKRMIVTPDRRGCGRRWTRLMRRRVGVLAPMLGLGVRLAGRRSSGWVMPWDAKSFAQKHNHSLKGKAAAKAASQATAMVKAGVPEGEAIATANKHAGSSPKSRDEHMAQRKSQGMTQKEVGAEFGRHRTTVGRVLRKGFTSEGSAR